MKKVAVLLENKHKICWNINRRLAEAFVDCFNQLGFVANLVTNIHVINTQKFDIVFSVAPSHETPFRRKIGYTTYIMYQSEQLPQRDLITHRASLCWQRFMKDVQRYDIIFDFSPLHVEYMRSMGLRVFHFQLGYHKFFDYTASMKLEREVYDISFVGNLVSENSRREYFLEKLEVFCNKNKLSHMFTGPILGDDYYRLQYRSKICLNIHHTYIRCCEGQKVTDLLSNQRFLLTEPFGSEEPYQNQKHLAIRQLPHFEETILHYLKQEDERVAIAQRGYDFICQLRLVDGLRATLKQAGIL